MKVWHKVLFWILQRTLKVALEINRHLVTDGDKVYFDCPDDPRDPEVVFDLAAFYDVYFEIEDDD